MTRDDAERLAGVIRQTFLVLDDHPKDQKGAKLLALMLAQHVEEEGKMGGRIFLQTAGLVSESPENDAAPRKKPVKRAKKIAVKAPAKARPKATRKQIMDGLATAQVGGSA